MVESPELSGKGETISLSVDGLNVPDRPVIPFIEGDGVGPDIMNATRRVVNEAVSKAYNNSRQINWLEIYAGEKANIVYDSKVWLPDETVEAICKYKVALKGPVAVNAGREQSVSVQLRQKLDLYVSRRPVRYFKEVPSPVKNPEKINVVIFRENTEDIYAGIEYMAGSSEAEQLAGFLRQTGDYSNLRFPESTAFAVKPVSKEGTERLVRAAIDCAIENNYPSVTLIHKGNVMRTTEHYFKEWGYELAAKEYAAETISFEECGGNPPDGKILIKDEYADVFMQRMLTHPERYSVIATLNLNGDYISSALAAQVGGVGISPGANVNLTTGLGVFEVTHGTMPKYAGLDKANPLSLILSAEMMLRYMKWTEAADILTDSIEKTIAAKTVTYDFARQIDGAIELKCSEFATEIMDNISASVTA